MPKRSKTKSSAKRKIGKKPDRLAEVYIKEEKDVLQSSSTDSSSSSSSDSSDSDYLRKVKKLKRKDLNGKKYYKKIRKQIDTFQQNVDIKLNYMDMVLKNILKAQNAHVPVVVPSSYNVNNESASVRIPEKQLDSKTMKNEIKLELDSVEELEYFEERLKSDEDYREKVMLYLLKYSNAFGHRSQLVGRIYNMMDLIMTPELKALYNWSGSTREKKNPNGSPTSTKIQVFNKRSFKLLPNILLLVFDCMSTFNFEEIDMTKVKNYITDYFKGNRKRDYNVMN